MIAFLEVKNKLFISLSLISINFLQASSEGLKKTIPASPGNILPTVIPQTALINRNGAVNNSSGSLETVPVNGSGGSLDSLSNTFRDQQESMRAVANQFESLIVSGGRSGGPLPNRSNQMNSNNDIPGITINGIREIIVSLQTNQERVAVASQSQTSPARKENRRRAQSNKSSHYMGPTKSSEQRNLINSSERNNSNHNLRNGSRAGFLRQSPDINNRIIGGVRGIFQSGK